MTQNCLLCWGSIFGDMENVEYSFMAITPMFTWTQSDNTG